MINPANVHPSITDKIINIVGRKHAYEDCGS